MRLIRQVVLEWAHIKDKMNTFQSHKIKVIAIVYWESVKLKIFSPEWIFHARWLSLDTLPNMLYPIFHVGLSTSEKRSVNHNSNLIEVVVFAQYWEVGLRWWFSIHWGNIPGGGGGALDFQMVGVCRWGVENRTLSILNRSAHEKYTLS